MELCDKLITVEEIKKFEVFSESMVKKTSPNLMTNDYYVNPQTSIYWQLATNLFAQ